MREARMIIPASVNRLVAARTAEMLSETFGGYTESNGIGQWKDESENIRIYDVAMDDTPENTLTFLDIAKYMCIYGAQEAVYVRLANGDVKFVS